MVTVAAGALTLAACLGGPASLPPLEDRTGRAGQLPSGTCDFDIRMITNGAYPEAATSLWSCVQPNGTLLQVVIFDNFTGTSSAIGAFDFVTTGCRAGLIRDRLGRQALVTNLYGSRAAGTLSFEQEGVGAIACALVASNYADRRAKARTQAAKTQIELLGVALDTFRLDVGRYPTTHEGLQALRTPPDGLSRWDGPYPSLDLVEFKASGVQRGPFSGDVEAIELRIPEYTTTVQVPITLPGMHSADEKQDADLRRSLTPKDREAYDRFVKSPCMKNVFEKPAPEDAMRAHCPDVAALLDKNDTTTKPTPQQLRCLTEAMSNSLQAALRACLADAGLSPRGQEQVLLMMAKAFDVDAMAEAMRKAEAMRENVKP